MNGTTALHDIYDLLQSVEHYCYQVAYYVLGNESDAAAASEGALLALACDSAFTIAAAADRRALAKKAAVACAMKRARERCASDTPKELDPRVAND
ncbi:hypothetical protein [Paenibacillus sacheonensis]|uniref:Uncharacterized protein n=1 Tax=Paenibacillus sacheonensis TaxID=742054 RepID=A0A7X4YTF2_9BACL|nr:hypothetical protein [Paenibacillus sacheonensis]MBM7565697.1 membrane-bound ClpP family serine protease [Paenibacillus sacheonensis]NBC72245.1 hypothetical protein [Paenibacillus sacheonensis]